MAYITLDKKHFFNNLDIIAKLSYGKDKIALVLKDNAYGHGLREMAQMAQEYGITKAVVRLQEEAEIVADFFDYILVLADIPEDANEKIRYTINDLANIEKFPKGTKVEIKVNTGMNRNGIEMDELREAFEAIKKHGLQLEAVFTHHSCADEDACVFEQQNKNFAKIKEDARVLQKEFGMEKLRFHSCNSAALFQTKHFSEDMARVGIAAYGCMELPQSQEVQQLQSVLSVYAKKISTRHLHEGDCVGYGASYKADKSCIVGNYDFGYGDGFLRICSNQYVTPQGIKLLGRISMDNSSFLSDDRELLIFDDAREIAKAAQTISYEVLTSLKANLKRVVLE
ncbi:alanine racemase [Sulfurimonas paralvinellae]|uniref:Alanine racemase n=1 Tax=Sulfurimonas paralvinellae TaxID=317658 RepID=A0A7M1B5L8_9BACT|nr:alanine racemase [Sulfurimonas paralvinellae]QOP45029.1 alanine racemase [Sulfurimonas paralvinellae]